MAFLFEFLYEDGELVEALRDEDLDGDKIKTILKLKRHDTVQLGSGSEKQNYEITEINRSFTSAKYPGQHEDTTHFKFTVKSVY